MQLTHLWARLTERQALTLMLTVRNGSGDSCARARGRAGGRGAPSETEELPGTCQQPSHLNQHATAIIVDLCPAQSLG